MHVGYFRMSKRRREIEATGSGSDGELEDYINLNISGEISEEEEEEESGEESEFSDLSSELDTEPEEIEDKEDVESEDMRRKISWLDDVEDTDTSDEEEVRNTVGNIPVEWYESYPHLGYNLDGEQVAKPVRRDELEEFLSRMEDPNYWRTVRDKMTGREVVLTEQQMSLVQKLQNSKFPEDSYDQYEPYVDIFSHEVMVHPLNDTVKPKSSFIPSRWEAKQVSRLVHAIKMGWLKPRPKPDQPKFYMLWGQGDESTVSGGGRHRMHIPAPKPPLPGHSESYNPPPEFLPTPDEVKHWEEEEDEEDRPSFLPHKYNSLREVPAYSKFIQERFERCLDLYLCPRQRKMRVQVDPDDLIPKLPKPRDLQPFPTTETIVYEGHSEAVRCVDIEPIGQWMASGSEDGSVRLWEILTGRCVKSLSLPSPPSSLSFSPSPSYTLMAVAAGGVVYIINHELGDKLLVTSTDSRISLSPSTAETTPTVAMWEECTEEEKRSGFRVRIQHNKPVKEVVWHSKGDYMSSLIVEESSTSVVIHQLAKRRSQKPFKNVKGVVQRVKFHPTRPLFFVATQTMVKVYDLARQEMVKKLNAGVKWISSIDIHPGGDNLILGGYDKRVCWFDMDLSNKPYRVIRQHKQAVRGVRYHKKYPLFASCSDDANITICHGMVYDDLMENPMIVPVKVLRGHRTVNSLGVLEVVFHPNQPWLISAGADSTLRLYT